MYDFFKAAFKLQCTHTCTFIVGYWYKLSSILQYKMHVPTDAFIII